MQRSQIVVLSYFLSFFISALFIVLYCLTIIRVMVNDLANQGKKASFTFIFLKFVLQGGEVGGFGAKAEAISQKACFSVTSTL